MSLILYHETNTKKLEYFLVDKKPEYFNESELEKLPKTSADHKLKDLKFTLNSMNLFPLSLVVSFMGSKLKKLRIYWYKIWNHFNIILS